MALYRDGIILLRDGKCIVSPHLFPNGAEQFLVICLGIVVSVVIVDIVIMLVVGWLEFRVVQFWNNHEVLLCLCLPYEI